MTRSTSAAGRRVKLLIELLWWAFLWVSLLAFVVMPFGFGEVEIRESVRTAGLQEALVKLASWLDMLWLLLAWINLYLWLVAAEGLATTRRWAGWILGISAVVCWTAARTDLPLGPIDYTDRMGQRIGATLPFTLPLLWFVIVICGRALVLRLWPRAKTWAIALATGVVALLTDINLEFVAWRVRSWWIWYPASREPHAWPPLQNFATWFLLAGLLTLLLREDRLESPARHRAKPLVILGLLNALCLAIHAVRALR